VTIDGSPLKGVFMLFRYHNIFLAFLLPAVIFAGPKITVDTSVFDVGTVFDGKNKTFKHVFKVKNTGDAPLVISSIRKSCGCTAVAFDSIIPAGGTGVLTEEVTIEEGASPGNFSMPVTLLSDARNSPIFKLAVKGKLEYLIETQPGSFLLSDSLGKDTSEAFMLLRSNMKGLNVTGVTFSFNEKNRAFSWKSSIPMNYCFSIATAADVTRMKPKKTEPGKFKSNKPFSTPNTHYEYTYALRIRYPNSQQVSRFGDLIISTNHPDKPEVSMPGNIVIQ
jgi:hypothetical protein